MHILNRLTKRLACEWAVGAAGAAPHLSAERAQQALQPGGGGLCGRLGAHELMMDVYEAATHMPGGEYRVLGIYSSAHSEAHSSINSPLLLPPPQLTARCTTTALPFSSASAEGRMGAP